MQTLMLATTAVALAEIGDKTQLLSLLLASRYRKPWPICTGILVATLLNHALAAWLGQRVGAWLEPATLNLVVALSFFAIALWALVPDRLDGERVPLRSAGGVLLATTIAFFLAEMGDKTQVATVLLGARYSPLWEVVAGTTLGMLVANVPVVWLGARLAERLPLRAARIGTAILFAALGAWMLIASLGGYSAS